MNNPGHEDLTGIANAFALSAGLTWVAAGDAIMSHFINAKKEPIFYNLTGALIVTFLSFQAYKAIYRLSRERIS